MPKKATQAKTKTKTITKKTEALSFQPIYARDAEQVKKVKDFIAQLDVLKFKRAKATGIKATDTSTSLTRDASITLSLPVFEDKGAAKKSSKKKSDLNLVSMKMMGIERSAKANGVTRPHLLLDSSKGTMRLCSPSTSVALREKEPVSLLSQKCIKSRTARLLGIPNDNRPNELSTPESVGRPYSDDDIVKMAHQMLTADQQATTFYKADMQYDTVANYDYASYEYLMEPYEQSFDEDVDIPNQMQPILDLINDNNIEAIEIQRFLNDLTLGIRMGFSRLSYAHPNTLAETYLTPIIYEQPIPILLIDILARLYEMHLILPPPLYFSEYIAQALIAAVEKDASIVTDIYSLILLLKAGGLNQTQIDRFESQIKYTVGMIGWPNILSSAIKIFETESPGLMQILTDRHQVKPAGSMLDMPSSYPFSVFLSSSVNLGLRLTYRQDWHLLGVQPGEIVKTIPLGPGQSIKLSTMLSKRTKTVQTQETSQIVERTSESADTVKDSSEIVREITNSNNLFLTPGEGGFSYGPISVQVTKAPSYEEQKTSRNTSTSSQINESVCKTASKMQTQTKVSVSTEGETTFQETSSIEITNPNSEVAINYEYLHLQHLYEIFTRLAEVDGVVYVAEDMPAPQAINGNWVRKHASVISKVLLDEAFRPALADIINNAQVSDVMSNITQENMSSFLGSVADNFAKFSDVSGTSSQSGLTIPDIYSGAVKSYLDWNKDKQASDKSTIISEQQRRQFFYHLWENILHYCRAIWINEDNDQRMLRYRKRNIKVPLLWQVSSTGSGQFVWGLHTNINLVPSQKPSMEVAIEDVIMPGPPIGFYGNYAIYQYRGLTTPLTTSHSEALYLDEIIETLRNFYVDPDDPTAVLDPDLAKERDAVRMMSEDELNVFYTKDKIMDMIHYMPFLSDQLLDAEGHVLQPSRDQIAEYIFRRKHSRRVIVNSGNLYLNLRRGAGTALEPFKLLHRTIDVLKAVEERDKMKLENQRYEKRLKKNLLEDPEIEKLVHVDGLSPVD